MASTTAICDTFKQELMVAEHDFTNAGDVFRWALYTSAATHGAGTTAYSVTDEVTGTAYVAAGETAANVTPTIDTNVAITDWADITWAVSTITAASVLLYNQTHATDAAVAAWDFGGDQVSSGGDFTLVMPVYAAATAILRLA